MTTNRRALPRVKAVLEELDRAAAEYEQAKDVYEDARARYQAAGERFASVRRLAKGGITGMEWFEWLSGHGAVRYAGMSLAEAIGEYLTDVAFQSAAEAASTPDTPTTRFSISTPHQYDPWRSLEQIMTGLEEGGYEFRTQTPGREVNAGLTNLATKVKNDVTGLYATVDHKEILEVFIPHVDKPDVPGLLDVPGIISGALKEQQEKK